VIVVPVEAIGGDASRDELLILLDQLVASRRRVRCVRSRAVSRATNDFFDFGGNSSTPPSTSADIIVWGS